MATISGTTNERVYSIPKWLGLNEHPDGDTRLKIGEASTMVNWKVTRDGNLKRRPGSEFIAGLCDEYIAMIDGVITSFGFFKNTDTVSVYDEVSANQVPGMIVIVDEASGVIEDAKLKLQSGTISGGVASLNSDAWSVEDGVLISANAGTTYTFDELVSALAELEEGEYLYVAVDGIPYAINSTSLNSAEDGYYFGGYKVTAVPSDESDVNIAAMWTGIVGGKEMFLVACNGALYSMYDATSGLFVKTYIAAINTDRGVGFFQFDGKVYILNGYNYYVYNGTTLSTVSGYVPLVAIAISPDLGGGSESGETTGEYVNLLTNKRRVWLSPDGTNATFTLPETAKSVDSVKYTADGSAITGYTFTANTDSITFTSVPTRSVNSIEVQYSVKTHADDNTIPDYRAQITSNLYSELYSGTTDTRIFIYGDGTNETHYSGMDYDGLPRADYFPDQYVVRVGDSNTPITAMIRHYGNLMCFKTSECWSLQHGVVELATGDLTPAIYCTPVNRDKGNIAVGQVRLVNNSPLTCSGTELYHWSNSSYYTSNLTRDERQAHRISDRVQKSIKEFDFTKACMWDDDDHQEFYIVQNGVALVWNYAADAWYRYEDFDAVRMCNFHGDLFIGSSDGKLKRIAEDVETDNGATIKAVWESGAIDFGADYMRKYAATLWVGLKPEHGTSVNVCVETDRKNTFYEKVVSSEKAKIAGQPFMVKTKIKAKKFEYYRLILRVRDKMPPATVTNVDIKVRQTGYAK